MRLPPTLIRRRHHRLGGEVRVACRGLDLRVAEELADHRQSLTGGDGSRREGVAQVVDADVLEPGAGADALPERLKVGEAACPAGCR